MLYVYPDCAPVQHCKWLFCLGTFGAPGTIRTCDRLVRSLTHFQRISISCSTSLRGKSPPHPQFINNLPRVYGAMRYGSVCSGIEAASVAWEPLGWRPAFFSEIDKFPRAALRHHYAGVPLHGDFTTIGADQYGPIDLLVGGTPCQAFSIAGLRKGLDDDRGNLALGYTSLAYRTGAKWLVWENVPGVLSSNAGEDFRCFLSSLAGWEIAIPETGWQNAGIITPGPNGYGLAWRVLDAQHFGVPQRRKRVFLVGYFGDWRPAAAVLFERHSMQGHPPPSREERKDSAPGLAKCLKGASGGIDREDGHTIIPEPRTFAGNIESQVAATLQTTCDDYSRSDGFNCVAIHGTQDPDLADEMAHTLGRNSGQENAIAIKKTVTQYGYEVTGTLTARHDSSPCTDRGQNILAQSVSENVRGELSEAPVTNALTGGGGKPGQGYPAVRQGMTVRRLTPIECERLQGFPDNYTAIPYRGRAPEQCPDGPRYKALGNSMAVPVMRWIGERIQMVEDIVTGLNTGEG